MGPVNLKMPFVVGTSWVVKVLREVRLPEVVDGQVAALSRSDRQKDARSG